MPGCVTMTCVRDEMAGAIKQYAEPVTDRLVFKHQVLHLGTDRRLTYCMLSQGKHLRTLFVPHAVSETVAPQDLVHYLSQRRRWGSNAYFNSYFYFSGSGHWAITRLWASMDIARQTLVYYRFANTIMFIYGLYHHFVLINLVPYIVVTQVPTLWFFLVVLLREPILRRQAHKLVLGWAINKIMSPILALLIFSNVVLHLGSPGKLKFRLWSPAILVCIPELHNKELSGLGLITGHLLSRRRTSGPGKLVNDSLTSSNCQILPALRLLIPTRLPSPWRSRAIRSDQ